jgi:putative spermidine/putrescine transport system permease protein
MLAGKSKVGRLLIWVLVIFVLLFLAQPLFIVFPISFSSSSYLEFPPRNLSFKWYQDYFSSHVWLSATLLSLKVALMTMLLTTVIGTLAAFGFARTRLKGKGLLFLLTLSPMLIPTIVISVAVYSLFAKTYLIENIWGLVIGHSLLASPFVLINVFASLQGFDINLERASAILGATKLRTFYHITFPLIRPGILTGALFAFLISFEELVVSMWVSGSRYTLPVKMWMDVRLEINPTLAAVSSLLIVLSIIIFLSIYAIRRRTERRYS